MPSYIDIIHTAAKLSMHVQLIRFVNVVYNYHGYHFTCSWLEPLFWTGSCRKGSLDQSDLYAHPEEADSEKLLNAFNRYTPIILSLQDLSLHGVHVCSVVELQLELSVTGL